jgi:hypothetical protein
MTLLPRGFGDYDLEELASMEETEFNATVTTLSGAELRSLVTLFKDSNPEKVTIITDYLNSLKSVELGVNDINMSVHDLATGVVGRGKLSRPHVPGLGLGNLTIPKSAEPSDIIARYGSIEHY